MSARGSWFVFRTHTQIRGVPAPFQGTLTLLTGEANVVTRTHDGPQNKVFPYVYTQYLVLIITRFPYGGAFGNRDLPCINVTHHIGSHLKGLGPTKCTGPFFSRDPKSPCIEGPKTMARWIAGGQWRHQSWVGSGEADSSVFLAARVAFLEWQTGFVGPLFKRAGVP